MRILDSCSEMSSKPRRGGGKERDAYKKSPKQDGVQREAPHVRGTAQRRTCANESCFLSHESADNEFRSCGLRLQIDAWSRDVAKRLKNTITSPPCAVTADKKVSTREAEE